jgi:hypothetical protein
MEASTLGFPNEPEVWRRLVTLGPKAVILISILDAAAPCN